MRCYKLDINGLNIYPEFLFAIAFVVCWVLKKEAQHCSLGDVAVHFLGPFGALLKIEDTNLNVYAVARHNMSGGAEAH